MPLERCLRCWGSRSYLLGILGAIFLFFHHILTMLWSNSIYWVRRIFFVRGIVMRTFQFSRVLMVFLALAVGFTVTSNSSLAEDAKVHNIDFIMAHKPDNADNVQLIKDFASRVKERTNGTVVIRAVEVGAARERPHFAAIRKIYNGDSGMSQVSVKELYPTGMSSDVDVLDMPMLFRSHDHATKVLDGQIGDDLIKTVNEGSNGNIRGLAFTYSGGFRNYFSLKSIDSLGALKGKTMRYLNGRMSRDFAEHLGVDFKPSTNETATWASDHINGHLDVDESEVIRLVKYQQRFPSMFKGMKTVLETNHNLFLTLVIINGELMDSLTVEQQKIVQEEADKLAEQERKLSIQQEVAGKAEFQKAGITFVSMSDADKKIMEDAAAKVHAKHDAHLGKWIRAIKATQ